MAGKSNYVLEFCELEPSELEEVSKLYGVSKLVRVDAPIKKKIIKESDAIVVVYDLQAVMPIPKGKPTAYKPRSFCIQHRGLGWLYSLLDESPIKCIRAGPKGYYITESFKELASDIVNMEVKEGDIFVVTYLRSGTTLTQELVWLVANDFDYEKAAAIPILERYPFLDLTLFFEEMFENNMLQELGVNEKSQQIFDLMSTSVVKVLEDMPSPRFVKAHLPLSLLPPKLLDTAKVVYVARDPRDVMVSVFHLAKLFKQIKFIGNFRQLWSAFIKDLYNVTPYFEHVKEAWSLKDHPNMLFLFYEDMLKDMPATIKRVADFLGKDVSSAQIQRLCEHLSIDNFKNNKSVNFESMRDIGMLDSREQFIRKGKVGGWRAYFDDEMMQETERWIKKNLEDTDLRFPSIEF